MVEIKGKTIIYKVPNSLVGLVSPYLLMERLAYEIADTFPQIQVNKLFASRMENFHKVYCNLPKHYSKEQILLVSKQIEIIAASLLEDLQEKIYLARLAS